MFIAAGVGVVAVARFSVRGVLLLVGRLGYVIYQYGYAFAYGWSRLFPVHVGLLALSASTLVDVRVRLDVAPWRRAPTGGLPSWVLPACSSCSGWDWG